MSQVIPVKLEVMGSTFKKGVGWTVVGTVAGAVIAGPLGALIGLATQGNNQKFTYTVFFSDETQKVYTCEGKDLDFELSIWTWRINNQRSEKDYVTFGLQFANLQRDMTIPCKEIQRLLGIDDNPSGFKDALKRIGLMRRYTQLLKKEIERYLKEQCNDIVIVQVTDGFDIKIPSKATEVRDTILGGIGLVVIGGMIFGGCQHQSSNSSASSYRECYENASKAYVDSTLENEGNHPVSSSDINRYYNDLNNIRDACQ